MWGALIAAAVGGTINAISGVSSRREARKRLRAQRDEALGLMDLNYDIAEKNANKNADRQDAQSDLNEKFIANNANNQLDALRNAQETEAFSFNQQAMQNSAQEGNSLSSMAASGTRGGSMNTAVELQSSLNSQQLQLAENSTRAQDENSLFNILNNFQNDAFKLQNDRTDAQDLRDAYVEGTGDQWKLYNANRNKVANEYNNAIKDNESNFWTVVGDFFGGAQKGYDVGAAVSGFMKDASAYKTTGSGNSQMSFNSLSGSSSDIYNYYTSASGYSANSKGKGIGAKILDKGLYGTSQGLSSIKYATGW